MLRPDSTKKRIRDHEFLWSEQKSHTKEHYTHKRAFTMTVISNTPGPESRSTSPDSLESQESARRYIPKHKKQDSALTFPEKVGYFLVVVENSVSLHNSPGSFLP